MSFDDDAARTALRGRWNEAARLARPTATSAEEWNEAARVASALDKRSEAQWLRAMAAFFEYQVKTLTGKPAELRAAKRAAKVLRAEAARKTGRKK
jgi:hypothetical protein